MAKITLSFDGTVADLNDFCYAHNYQDIIFNDEGEEAPNTETKVQYFERKVKEFVHDSVRSRRINNATKAAITIEKDKDIDF